MFFWYHGFLKAILEKLPQFIKKINLETTKYYNDDDYQSHDYTLDTLWYIIDILQMCYKVHLDLIQEHFPKIAG